MAIGRNPVEQRKINNSYRRNVTIWYGDELLEKPITVQKENAPLIEERLKKKYETTHPGCFTVVEPFYDIEKATQTIDR